MLTSSDAFSVVTPRLSLLVKRAEYATGSRMLAYANVARAVGTSASWVRKVLGNQPVAEPSWRVVTNLINEYEAACARLEEDVAAEKARFLALSRESHAVVKAEDRPLGAAKSVRKTGARRASGMVPDMVDEGRR
ncbi:hypothetical protein [Methylobacterium bullatum]|uniref:KfrA N-terminal DNA-binding domain-containing protein n=1 Tax=Methylobacterium bullatum TaxID=570505 RepID=A0AAV4ZB50_9HYPH|nr:hypothetical protein [Methylobacterium bullatum]MBD8902749.1 hypothetical protein [Methylobacterium bullatum]GJD41344.1 hypothetical protein OICFNHDK_3827 [Methylobacterium bullatum]